MPKQVVNMRARGFICVNAHPGGCAKNVGEMVAAAHRDAPAPLGGVKNALVIGSSTGYGLASRIAVAWGFAARTLGVFFERPPEGDRTATAGWYNTAALDLLAKRDHLFAAHINGDAFSDEVKRQALERIRRDLAPVDLVVYSLASPRRTHPHTGEVHNSTLKPIGGPYSSKTIDLATRKVVDVTIAPASEKEIADTISVMGGEDWEMWLRLLDEEGLLASGVRTIAYSYIGPSVTWPVYRDGTIGRAKEHLEHTARMMDAWLAHKYGGHAWISVNKAVVTQASAAIPVVPLYMSLLFKVMGEKNLDEDTGAQMRRLFLQILADGKLPSLDSGHRIRLDDREMRDDVQAQVSALWPQVNTENLLTLSAYPKFERGFRSLFGFEVEGMNYSEPVETDVSW